MLYYLFRYLGQYDIPGSHMWSYISFRALLTLILALLLSAWFGERFIKWMKKKKIFETERDPKIDPFGVEKKGVPTMGGIIIIVSILIHPKHLSYSDDYHHCLVRFPRIP